MTETTPRTLLPTPPNANRPVTPADREWLLHILAQAAEAEGIHGESARQRALALRTELDGLTRKHTAFGDFLDLVFDPGGSPNYRPSIYTAGEGGPERFRLANGYDFAQVKRKDARRAYRGGGK